MPGTYSLKGVWLSLGLQSVGCPVGGVYAHTYINQPISVTIFIPAVSPTIVFCVLALTSMSAFGPFSIGVFWFLPISKTYTYMLPGTEHFFDLDSFERDQEERLASSGHSGQSPEAGMSSKLMINPESLTQMIDSSDITIDSSPCPSPMAVIPFQEDVLHGTSDLEVGKGMTPGYKRKFIAHSLN